MNLNHSDEEAASDRCDRCGGHLRDASRPKAIEKAGRVVVVRRVPVRECVTCGAAYLVERVAEGLDQLFTELLTGPADVAVATYPTGEPAQEEHDRSTLDHETFDSLAREVSEARQFARMLLQGRSSGMWDPAWFGIPGEEADWPAWLTSVGGDYGATADLPPELVDVTVVGRYTIRVTFADGLTGIVDAAPHLWGPVYRPLHDPEYFARVQLRDGTAEWPNGADFAPEMLYREALRNQIGAFHIDADLNMEDDAGRNMGRVPEGQPELTAGEVGTAGRPGGWSWVVVDEVKDGFVFFHQVSADEAKRLLARDDAEPRP